VEPKEGERLGPYRLRRKLGEGGMATVHLAEDERFAGVHRLTAIKVVHPHLRENSEILEMFADEASVACSLAHPNVCRVSDFGAYEGVPFLAMEYLCGPSLFEARSHLTRARQTGTIELGRWFALVVRLLQHACEGVHALHQLCDGHGTSRGAVHRDISHDNLVLSCSGVLKVVDFGIVRASGRRHQTEAGVFKGKLSYVAPEVLLGEDAASAADIWSLGVVAWEVLTGRRLFRRASERDSAGAILRGTIPPPSRYVSGIPRALDLVILQALDRDPALRPVSARALGRALLFSASELALAAEPHDIQRWLFETMGHDAGCLVRALGQRTEEATLVPVELMSSATNAVLSCADAQSSSARPTEGRRPDGTVRAGVRVPRFRRSLAVVVASGIFLHGETVGDGLERGSTETHPTAVSNERRCRVPARGAGPEGFTLELRRGEDVVFRTPVDVPRAAPRVEHNCADAP